jgi:hypothetical protein
MAADQCRDFVERWAATPPGTSRASAGH